MKCIVFGGTGWLGHNIALQLQQAGQDITICSRGQKSLFGQEVSDIKTITADKEDPVAMKEIFAERYDVVIDTVPCLGSIALVYKYGSGIRHYIHCSSTGGYSPLPFVPCDETAPYGGFDNNSGWRHKAEADAAVMRLFRKKGFPATVIRPCYITGPGKFPLDNSGGRRSDYIADIIAERVLDVPDNGLALLQPVHIIDLAVSFRLVFENPHSIGEHYNICLSHAVTLRRYHEITASVFGKQAHLNYLPVEDMLQKYTGREIGLRFLATHMCFSIEKARRDLGYIPHCSPEKAIEETALWASRQ
ncbi:MAG: NAD-dependent epimerase/dehydratase family protein [Victivallales bacterium]|nr:NAD-dependent epimerase/dehydratase family protein [Victivallales bacterium]